MCKKCTLIIIKLDFNLNRKNHFEVSFSNPASFLARKAFKSFFCYMTWAIKEKHSEQSTTMSSGQWVPSYIVWIRLRHRKFRMRMKMNELNGIPKEEKRGSAGLFARTRQNCPIKISHHVKHLVCYIIHPVLSVSPNGWSKANGKWIQCSAKH